MAKKTRSSKTRKARQPTVNRKSAARQTRKAAAQTRPVPEPIAPPVGVAPDLSRLKSIVQVSSAIVGEVPLVQQAAEMAERVCATLNVDGCVIRLLDDNELLLLASAGIPEEKLNDRIPVGWGIAREILTNRRSLSIANVYAHPATAPLVRGLQNYYEFTSYAGAPLIARDQVIGIIGVFLEHETRHFKEVDLEYLQILANNISVAVINDRLYNQLKNQKDQLETEIAERRRTEQALRESEQRFQSAFDYAAIGMVLVTPDGHFLKANHSMCEIIGYSEEELLIRTFQDITHPDDLAVDLAYVDQVLKGKIRTYQMEKRYFHKLGHVVWVVLSVSLVRDKRGRPLHFISQIQDITARKKAEASLQESDQRLREQFMQLDQLYKFSPVGLSAIGRDLRFQRINDQLAEIDGLPAEAYLGHTIHEVLPGLAAHLQELWRPVFDRGEPVLNVEISGTTAKAPGVLRHWLCNYFPMTSATGEITGVLSAIVEITERKQAEKEREQLQAQLRHAQKMEAVGRLSGGIAHDFNNLLTVVQGNAEIASMLLGANMSDRKIERLSDALEQIQGATQRAALLTGQLLTFSRKHVTSVHVLDMNVVIRDMESLLRRVIREDIALEIFYGPDKHLIKADKTQIEQVLINLAVNASDAMPDGGTLTVRVESVSLDETYARNHVDATAGPHLLISVSDTGTGMDQSTLEQLFEPFFTTKPFGKGTGLGLAIVYGIMRQSGGHIVVESRPGTGSTFKLFFPAAHGVASESTDTSKPHWEGGHETILLCEDEEPLRRLAAAVLADSGYTVIEAATGEQAIQLAAHHPSPIQLLITDVVMPGMKGDKLAAMIVKSRPDVQVLFMSGYASDVLKVESLIENGVEFLQKPFRPEALLRRVRDILSKARK